MPVRRPKNINLQIKVHHSEHPSLMQINQKSRSEKAKPRQYAIRTGASFSHRELRGGGNAGDAAL